MTQQAQDGYAENWTQVASLRVRYLQAGSGPALVLVHGLLGYSFNWRRVIPAFARNYKVLAPDLPGSGFSACAPELDCRLSAAARRLLEFLDALGLHSCNIVGSSYGGATTMIAAAMEPSRFRRLILVSPANPWSRIGRKRLMLLRIPAVAAYFPTLAQWARPLQGYFVRRMYGDPRRLTAETLSSHFQPLARREVLVHAVQIVQTWREDMEELKSSLPRIAQIPTLLIWGSRDRTVDPASATSLCRQFESARVAVIEGSGHLPYEESPEEFSQMALRFLLASSPASAAVPHGK